MKSPSTPKSRRGVLVALTLLLALVAAACSSTDPVETATEAATEPATEAATETATTEAAATETAPAAAEASTTVRDSGLAVTVQPAGDHTVHSVVAPEQVFANATHILETDNSLVVFDTQFLLPNAQDFRAYADSLGKPIEAVFITHGHPDHFLGSEAFADLPVFALAEVVDTIAANGQAEIDEKQAEFGPDLIASTFVTPEVVEPGTMTIDGVDIELETVVDAEADFQLVARIPAAGAIVTGDVVYSGVHLILAGAPDTWTAVLTDLQASSDALPVVLAGHGAPATPAVYDANIEWLATAGELLGTVDSGEAFKAGLVEAFPDLGMDAAIDFVLPFLFPDEAPE